MNNEQILKNAWKNTDKELKKWLVSYKKVNKKTQDKIQAIFDSLDIEYKDINKPISNAEKGRLDRYLLELQEKGLFNDYFGYKARKILNKNKATYKEMLEIMIEGCYIEENSNLEEYNNELFYNVATDGYNRGLKDINKPKLKPFTLPIYYTIMNIPIFDMTAKEYMYQMALLNANDLYKDTLIRLQTGKDLNVDDRYFKDIFQKQQNAYLKPDTMSGGIGNITDVINNESYLEAGIENNVEKCRFIAKPDDRTTGMCESLNNQIFLLNDWNEFDRMAGTSQKDLRLTRYRVKGLVQGINLPPITSHFHYCRSCITYDIDGKSMLKINIIKTVKGVNFVDGYIKLGKRHPIYEIENIEVPSEDSEEFKYAIFLKEKLGGRIDMIPRMELKKGTKETSVIQTPDYMWNGESWDIKGINGNTKNTIGHKFEQYKNQTDNIILYANNTTLSDEEICNYMQLSLNRYSKYYDSAIYINRKKEIVKINK